MKYSAFVISALAGGSASAFAPAGTITRQNSTPLFAVKTKDSPSTSTSSRLKRTTPLTDWAKTNDIKVGGVEIVASKDAGLGLYSTQNLSANDIVIQVPTKLTLSVESPTDYNTAMEKNLFSSDPKAYRNSPWWTALSIQLNYYDKVDSVNQVAGGVDIKPWIDSLPRAYDTPFHWSESSLDELQYRPMMEAVALQKRVWRKQYDDLAAASKEFSSRISYDDFVWGCETARSRAFSGAYSGSAFNPIPYATVTALVAAYIGLGIGTVEQAANGAALVVCGSILKDFVFPKLLKAQKYVICPLIDMANHVGVGATGNVAFEYFSDGFSLSALDPGVQQGKEMYISYGPRNNDQLLQYYGFVEQNNAHDVYILPPIRDWNIEALEQACGRKVGPGRLEKLDRAGLLGFATNLNTDTEAANSIGGVVLTRATGIDPAVIQALRALMSSDDEWDESGEAIGNFAAEVSPANERAARTAVRRAMELELESKTTTIEEDENLLKMYKEGKGVDNEEVLAVLFRLEKKKLLQEAIRNMV
mmetsp:Transcript_10349/g.14860  ORF Transcript_10349/g.14860 Transcript_10349/m.14860 type:complete len:532 (-) Transcript_10349:65-1660(-)|eukprot:CAMPEP_0201697890 /NCGR_PEP_ID=MMETSP0578-20130828/15005_1 /ASSEMBLY_ACC=CAM_ASM_000663 /TAXON_ID=267565 /ORGANISM="Skeletonema grethea, Strain CCMP 1804" /LENGTH=531 /DNA_ID=CAMNT_0048184249 /DNA_START=53 /DNA_END=1648 /DNA_ORIENTATION=-